MAIYKKEVVVCRCERCNFEWIPRTALKDPNAIPIRCANRSCNSPYWQIAKKSSVVTC